MILTVNCGSSSVRLDLFEGTPVARIATTRAEGGDVEAALSAFLPQATGPIEAVAHRIVHGGPRFSATTRIDDAVERELGALVELAPLHNAPALEGLRAARRALPPGIPHFAVFDTAFFAVLPAAARTYALPAPVMRAHGLRRYGFHGLAHQAMWNRWSASPPGSAAGRLISFQLGAGCSVAAIRGGAPLDTSMGFTPLEGLVMATRAGDVDAGLLTHLQRVAGLSAQDVDTMLYRQSGLLGLAGESSVGKLLERSDDDARLAIEVYCLRARRYLGAFLAVLGGAEGIAFGGGVGENVPAIRARILAGMEWAGIRLDAAANEEPGTDGAIGASDSLVDLRVIAVDEGAVLAAEARAAMRNANGG